MRQIPRTIQRVVKFFLNISSSSSSICARLCCTMQLSNRNIREKQRITRITELLHLEVTSRPSSPNLLFRPGCLGLCPVTFCIPPQMDTPLSAPVSDRLHSKRIFSCVQTEFHVISSCLQELLLFAVILQQLSQVASQWCQPAPWALLSAYHQAPHNLGMPRYLSVPQPVPSPPRVNLLCARLPLWFQEPGIPEGWFYQ